MGIADLLSKHAIVAALPPGSRRSVIPHILSFVLVRNAHGAMGLFGGRPALFIALSFAVLAVLVWLMRAALQHSPLAQAGFGMVAGGAAGNVVDRFVHGWVVDFIAVRGFYVFNVADAGITAGLGLIAYAYLREPGPRR